MIEKMKKVHMLLTSGDADKYLAELQKLGLVHLQTKSVSGHSDIAALLGRISLLKKTFAALAPYFDDSTGPDEAQKMLSADEIQKQALQIMSDIQHCRNDIEQMKKAGAALAPWGAFDPAAISNLERQGIYISFHIVARKIFQTANHAGRHFEIISEDRARFYLVEIRRAKPPEAVQIPFYPEERLGDMGSAGLCLRLKTSEDEILESESKLRALSRGRNAVETELRDCELRLERLIAAKSLESHADDCIQCLIGFVPVSLLPKLDSFFEARNILPIYDNPRGYEAPIKLRNSAPIRLFEPITKIFEIPRYTEIDTTPFLAPFFAFFFGFCLADLGYGIVLTISALAVLALAKRQAFKSIAALAAMLGFCTVLGGLFLNTFFGAQIDGIPNLPDGIASFLLFRDMNDAMYFSIFLGMTQMLIGFIMQIANKWRQDGLIASFQPLGTFLLLMGIVIWVLGALGASFAIGPLRIGSWAAGLGMPNQIGWGLSLAGIILILLFSSTQKRVWLRPILGLWELYGIITELLKDALSYIRLFALSLASGLLGGAVNLIAMMIRGSDPGFFSWIPVLIVLLAGHSANFALAALGAFIHPLRLTFVEFYKAVGFRGGGTKYAPYGGGFA